MWIASIFDAVWGKFTPFQAMLCYRVSPYIWGADWRPVFCLAATAVVVAAIVIDGAIATATAVAEDQQQDNNPPPVVTTEAATDTVIVIAHKITSKNFVELCCPHSML